MASRRSPSGYDRILLLLLPVTATMLCLSLLIAPDAFAGMVIREETTMTGVAVQPGSQPGTKSTRSTVLYLEGKKIRTETDKHVFILDFDAGKILTLNDASKSYSEFGLEQLREAQKQAVQWMANLRDEMKKNLESLPPEKRAEMEKKIEALPRDLLQPDKPAKISVKATGKQEKINGFPCLKFEIYEDDQKTAVYWLTTSVSNKLFDMYQTELSKWMEGMPQLGGDRLREWQQIRDKGLPIKIERTKPVMGKILYTWEVKQIAEESLSGSLFQPPEGYKRSEVPLVPAALPDTGTTPSPPPGLPSERKPDPASPETQGQGE